MGRYKLIDGKLIDLSINNQKSFISERYKPTPEEQKMNNTHYYQKEYEREKNKQFNVRKNIDKSFNDKGVMVNTNNFSTQRISLPVQQQTEYTKTGFKMNNDNLKTNVEKQQTFQNLIKSNEYKKQEQDLIEQSNKTGYAKYNYDKAKVDEENIGLMGKIFNPIITGATNIFDINGGLIKNENGDYQYLPSYNDLKHEKTMNSYNSGIGKFYGNVTHELGKIGTSTAINMALPGVGSTLYYGKMFVDSTNNAVSEGYDTSSATIYGLTNVALEYATGKILGSATKGLTGGKTGEYEKFLNDSFSMILGKPKVAKILANAGSEATEEFVQEYLDNFAKMVILDKRSDLGSILTDKDIFADAVYSAAIGGVTGGIMGSATSKDTNVENNDIYKVFKEELEETRNKDNISGDTKNKIDSIISEIDKIQLNENETVNIPNTIDKQVDTIQSQINEYQTLKEQNKITKKQELELNKLQEQLDTILNQNTEKKSLLVRENLPTIQNIINQEKTRKDSINLPTYSQRDSSTSTDINFNQEKLPTVNDFNSSNINMPTSDIKIDMAKIKPEILEDIKGFKLGDPSIEGYKGSYIKTMLNEVGIKVPVAMNYVSEVRPDMSFTTIKDLTRQQYSSISNTLQKLKSIDVTGVNNVNQVNLPMQTYQKNINMLNKSDDVLMKSTVSDNLIAIDENTKKSILSKNNNVIVSSKQELANLVKEALTDSSSNKNIHLGIIPHETINRIKNEIVNIKQNKIDTLFNDGTKYALAINQEEIRHLKKDSLSVPDVIEFIDTLDELIANFDSVSYTLYNKNQNALRFKKNMSDGTHIALEVISNKNHTLRTQTLFLESADFENKKRNLFPTLNEYKNSLSKTSKMDGLSVPFSDNNIPQNKTNVNLPVINNSNMLNPNEISQLKEENTAILPIPQDPTKESTYDEPEKLAEILKEKPPTTEEKDNWLKKLATIKFVDKGYYVDKLARKTNNPNLSSKYDYSLLSNGIANQIIGNGRVDEKGNKVGKGLYEIFEPIENSGLLDDFSKYIYHKHNVDRMSLQNRFNESNKAIFGDSVTSDVSEKIVNEYEVKYPEFEAWADNIYEYNNANLEMLVKYGVLSKDSMEYYNKKYPHYVPTIREQTKTKTQMNFLLGKKASVNNPIKKAKGGNGNIIPLKEAMALRTMQTVNSALRNNFGLELLNSIETEQIRNQENVDNIVEEINNDELLTKSSEISPATLTVFDKGEKVTFEISDEIYEALKPSNIKTFKVLNKLNNIRRGLLTEYNPTFMITNPLKDIQDGSINSKYPNLFIKNLPEAIKQIKNNGQYKQLYIANGGSYETYFNYNTGTNIVPSKLDKIAPLKKISEINELIEMAPRLAEFISSVETGDSIETAMYNASEITTNFKRGGDITKTLDRNGVTFLNAGVQGTTKQIRNVQEARVEGIKGITKLAVRWTIAGLIPTILMNMIWGDDDEYEELSDYVKNNYYIIGKYDDGEFIRIPKGRVVSVLQSFFQNALNGIDGKEIDLEGFSDLIKNNLLPSDPNESSLIAPIKQAINNETWYGGKLVPTRLQNLPDVEQYDETTDSISIWLGKMLNISPYKINYVLDQYAGAIGDYTLPYLTQAAESGSDSFTGKLLAPIKDKFTVDSTLKNQNISDFYSLSEELTKKSNGSNVTDEDVLKNKYVNSIKSEISKLYAKKREIQSSSLKDSEKYNQSKKIQKEINELSKQAINKYNNVKVYSDYGKISNEEYYLNNKKQWTKIDKKEQEEINNLNMSDNNKNEYFKNKVKIGIIKSNDDKDSKTKHTEISELLIKSTLSDECKGYLYGKYYSSEKIIDSILKSEIDLNEYIKFDTQEFESDYDNNGKAITNSRKNKVINYVNTLDLSIPQKAIIIKMEYQSFNKYDNNIIEYINNFNYDIYNKAILLKQIGFSDYNSYIINKINSKNLSIQAKEKELQKLGFKVKDGKVYS